MTKKTWYRGGLPKADAAWFSASREYAEFYGEDIVTVVPQGRVLDLSSIGVDVDESTLRKKRLPLFRTSSDEMYEWAEKAWPELQRKGYSGVVVMQWHADFNDRAYKSLLYWGAR